MRNADGGGDPNEDQSDEMYPKNFHFIRRNNTSLEVYWNDMAMFTKAIQSDLSCLARQVMLNDLLQPKEHNFEGTEQLIEERLFVRVLSFSLMTGLLACLVAITLVLLYFFVPVAVCPRDTGSIGGMAIIFAQSPEFMTSFEGSQLKTEVQMAETRLGQTHYSIPSKTEGAFGIIPQEKSTFECVNHSENEDPSPTWWYPFSSTWFIRIAVITLPIVVIIALEVVYYISTSSRGITLVDGKSPFIHYVWVYIPALIMFTIRCLFTSVEFGTRIVQPYSLLREGSAPPETTILENQLRKIALYGLFDTLRKRQLALAAATSSLFLAAINPIVVSGLYTAKDSWPTSPMNITQTTRWNLGDPTQSGDFWKYIKSVDFNTDKIAGLIIHLNLSDPQWTCNNLAFPQFILTDTINPPDTGYIDTRIPALRSQLICTEGQIGCKNSDTEVPYIQCGFDDPCYSATPWGTYVSSDEKSNFFFGGSMISPSSWNESRPRNCTTHGMLYGSWGNGLASRRYRFFNCNATIEEVDVDTRLQLPSLSIDSDIPPRVVPSVHKRVFNTTFRSFPELDYIGDYLFQADSKLGHLSSDVFVDALTRGLHGVPAEELMDPITLSARVNTVWGIIMAQMLNFNGRESFHDPLNTTWFVHPATSHALKMRKPRRAVKRLWRVVMRQLDLGSTLLDIGHYWVMLSDVLWLSHTHRFQR